jgi:hypothetical protein
MAQELGEAHGAIEAAVAAFPDRAAIASAALRAAGAIDAARAACPPALAPRVAHRLERQARELDAVLLEAGGLAVRAPADQPCNDDYGQDHHDGLVDPEHDRPFGER